MTTTAEPLTIVAPLPELAGGTAELERGTAELERGAAIPPGTDPDTFVSPDPLPLADAMYQEPYFTDIMATLRHYLRGGADTLAAGKSFLCYDRNDLNRRYEPDCYVAFGVDVAAIQARNGYMVWVAGKPPDFALEIASESTWRRDLTVKRRDYARIGIREYWRFDAWGRFYGAPLAGDRLVDGQYEPIPLEHRADGSIWGYSAVLDLYLCWDRGSLYFWDPKAGRFLHNLDRADAARQAAEAELAVTRNDLADTQGALSVTEDALAAARAGEQEARELLAAAEATIRRLRARLGDADGESDGDADAGGAAGESGGESDGDAGAGGAAGAGQEG